MKNALHLQTFLLAVNAIHGSGAGTKETSYYTAIDNLLDGIGHELKPKVACIMQLKSLGAGNPDGGLFTADQCDRKTGDPKDLSTPSRGVIEVKGLLDEVESIATTAQISKYWNRYKLVLVTNIRDWLLIGERDGKRVHLERFTLAKDVAGFVSLMSDPKRAEKEHGTQFADFLLRTLLHNAPLAEPEDLAWLLASYAREALARVEQAGTTGKKQVLALKKSLEQALGLNFRDPAGEHFFQSTLVQTLFYGAFSAWVLRHEIGAPHKFDWRTAAYDLHVPMISALFEQLSQPTKLKALNLTEVLDWATDALNRVDHAAFFKIFDVGRSVQYFYEPFLQAFDPELRKQLGVWYTPEQIVKYQVASVDRALQSELGIANGLADPNVIVLDPCCGTGAYLVEVLRTITERLNAEGSDALAPHELKKAAMTRLFGFELLPAPYVISHLQIGLLLRHNGAPLSDDERAAIYLTNSLTGWEPAKAPKTALLPFPELSDEHDAADHVKQTKKVIVIIGNPPYNAFSGVGLGEERGLVAPYKKGLSDKWGMKKFNLDDLYIRFVRLAERQIAEKSKKGIVSLITNSSYISDPSYVVMREHLLANFDKIQIDNLNGDSRETGKITPDGLPDPSVFSTEYNRAGIRKGAAIMLLSKAGAEHNGAHIAYRDWWGINKREQLISSLETSNVNKYIAPAAAKANRFSFRPGVAGSEYCTWPVLTELASELPLKGLEECRAGDLFDIDRTRLAQRIQLYYDTTTPFQDLSTRLPGLSRKAAGYDPATARIKLLAAETYSPERIVPFTVRPFDTQWCYYSETPPLWNRPRPPFWSQLNNNAFLITRLNCAATPEGFPMAYASTLVDKQMISRNPGAIPFRLHHGKDGDLFASTTANLSDLARKYLHALGLTDPDHTPDTGDLIWYHALAIGYSPLYVSENASDLRQDWPRIPLPSDRSTLMASAKLGKHVAALLDMRVPVPTVTIGSIDGALKGIAVISRKGGGPLKPAEFELNAGWGHATSKGVIMPGRGKLEARSEPGIGPVYDVYLNKTAYWANVPREVWEFTIGGYQAFKKWLSYRETSVLGRAMTTDEIREASSIARRIAALLSLKDALDKNYTAAKAQT